MHAKALAEGASEREAGVAVVDWLIAETLAGIPAGDDAAATMLEGADMQDNARPDEATRTELEAAAFRTLVEHLRAHPEVQNIDLMNLAGFCRNCLSKWYRAAAEERGLELSYEDAREIVYGMPYRNGRPSTRPKPPPAAGPVQGAPRRAG